TEPAHPVLATQREEPGVARSPQAAVAHRGWISRYLDGDHADPATVPGEHASVVHRVCGGVARAGGDTPADTVAARLADDRARPATGHLTTARGARRSLATPREQRTSRS